MATKDLPAPVRGVVRCALEPDDGRQTFELEQPIVYMGYPLDQQVFAWSPQDDRGFAWSMVVDLATGEPAMAGVLVGSELQARANAESAFRAAARAAELEEEATEQRVS